MKKTPGSNFSSCIVLSGAKGGNQSFHFPGKKLQKESQMFLLQQNAVKNAAIKDLMLTLYLFVTVS